MVVDIRLTNQVRTSQLLAFQGTSQKGALVTHMTGSLTLK